MTSEDTPITAALFDFGGVILSSPFDAFADYERANGLPADFIRGLNATDPDSDVDLHAPQERVSGTGHDHDAEDGED